MKVLALNLCASWTRPRAERLRMVAEFVKENGIDCLLLQEGLRICPPVYDTIRQLAGVLGYSYFAKSTFGFPFFYEFRIGVLSRFKILRTASLDAEVPQSEWMDAIPLPWRRRAVAAAVNVPGLGITTLVSVHLTSSPKSQVFRQSQFFKLRNWLVSLPLDDCCVIGGDFNVSLDKPIFSGAALTGQAPDYIMVDGARIVKGASVFKDHVVSDHVGIVAEIEL